MKIVISNINTYFAQTKSADKMRLGKMKVYSGLDDEKCKLAV